MPYSTPIIRRKQERSKFIGANGSRFWGLTLKTSLERRGGTERIFRAAFSIFTYGMASPGIGRGSTGALIFESPRSTFHPSPHGTDLSGKGLKDSFERINGNL